MEPIYHATGDHYVTEPHPTGDWNVVLERWPTGAGRDLTARRFFSRWERGPYAAMNLMEQRRWVIDVIAVKDSARRWLKDTYGIPSYPVEVTAVPDGPGRFRAVSSLIPEQHDLRVTVSSLNWLTVAIVGDGEYRDICALEVPPDGDGDAFARQAAEVVAERNPGARVESVPQVDHIEPSSIEFVVIPSFAVAWTA